MIMQQWQRITVLLCTYGFLRELRPNEPFVSEFLSGKWRDLTAEQVFQQVYPIGTYSYLALLVVIFLITDMLRYKPLIIVSAISGIIMYVALLWTSSLEALQAVQFFFGLYMATEVAYFTYIYAKVDREHYPVVTGFTRSAMLAGRFLAGVISQLLISFQLMDFRQLNYITLGTQTASLVWAVLLPGVATSIYFYAPRLGDVEHSSQIELQDSKGRTPAVRATIIAGESSNGRFSKKRAARLLWSHFVESYSNVEVLQWSVWWALATGGFMQVQSYVQFLWQDISPDREAIYNGGVEATLTLLGAGAASAAGFISVERFDAWGMWLLAVCSVLMGGLLLWGSLTLNIWISYAAYVMFGIATHFMITIASINIATRLKDDCFGLVFGINTLLALTVHTILTVVVVSEHVLAFGQRDHFTVNSGYFVVLGVFFGVVALVRLIVRRARR